MTKENTGIRSEDADSAEITSLCGYIERTCKLYPDLTALEDEYAGIKVTFAEMDNEITAFAAGLQSLGVKKGDKIAIFSENTARWIIIDQAILRTGAANAVRGSSAPISELEYIIEHSGSVGVILRDAALFEKMKEHLNKIKPNFVVIMFTQELDTTGVKFPLYTYDDIIAKGKTGKFNPVRISRSDDCTIIYTSGTTNRPKGVLLSHGNLMSQVELLPPWLKAQPREKLLAVLPIWHVYERGVEYYFLAYGCHFIYTNIRNIKSDMAKHRIDILLAVPRIWESVHANILNGVKNKSKLLSKVLNFGLFFSKINKKALRYINETNIYVKKYNPVLKLWNAFVYALTLPVHALFKNLFYEKLKSQIGLTFRICMSGGGALAPVFADFFEAIELPLIVGYGLTETSPVIALNQLGSRNVQYSAGKPVAEFRIVDPETREDLGLYEKGLVVVRGPMVMQEYYKNSEATAAALWDGGWFSTGDLGWMTNKNDIILTGREKEVIVLSNGENIEPEAIEQACIESLYIEQIMLVGQDRAVIGALVIPSTLAYTQFGSSDAPTVSEKEKIHKLPEFRDFIKKEIALKTKRPQFRSFERIIKFDFLTEEFTPLNGLLTQTAKKKRNTIAEKYAKQIDKMYK